MASILQHVSSEISMHKRYVGVYFKTHMCTICMYMLNCALKLVMCGPHAGYRVEIELSGLACKTTPAANINIAAIFIKVRNFGGSRICSNIQLSFCRLHAQH